MENRLREPQARILCLLIASQQPNNEASTAFIKDNIENYIELTEIDLQPSSTRPNEKVWQQIVGNVVSHSDALTSIFSQGYAARTDDGIRVTQSGLKYLTDLGY